MDFSRQEPQAVKSRAGKENCENRAEVGGESFLRAWPGPLSGEVGAQAHYSRKSLQEDDRNQDKTLEQNI